MSATRTTQPSSVEGRRVLMVDSSAVQASTRLSSCSKVVVLAQAQHLLGELAVVAEHPIERL